MTLKFRAWHKKMKKMYEVAHIRWDYNKITKVGVVWVRYNKKLEIKWFKAKDVILLQFIGKKDKNGKGIFEGDIVEWDWHKQRKRGDVGGLSAYKTRCGHYDLVYVINKNAVVIGNILENPELIRRKVEK